MSSARHFISFWTRAKNNIRFYFRNKRAILTFFEANGYYEIRPFNLIKWHHNLYLFTAKDKSGEDVFIKLSNIKRVLKNEYCAYEKLKKSEFLKNHLIASKDYLKKKPFRALVLKRSNGEVLTEYWMVANIDKLQTLIRIVDHISSLGLVHRDIKLDNFIYEDGRVKIFDFSFMVDKCEEGRLREIDLSKRKNMLKLMDLGIKYKPAPLIWDDYYSLKVIFKNFLEKYNDRLSKEDRIKMERYIKECESKVGTNSYTILEGKASFK